MPEAASSQEPSSTLQFAVNQVARDQLPADGIAGTSPSLLKQERRRRYQKSGRLHDWRTRQDPFEGVWEEITSWLVARPELTAAEIFRELERLYLPEMIGKQHLQKGLLVGKIFYEVTTHIL